MAYDYKARFLKTGEDTEIKNIFLTTNAEVYVEGELVTITAGKITQATTDSTRVLGICRKAGTGVTGVIFPVEVPLSRFVEVEMYSTGALAAGISYAVTATGAVDHSNSTTCQLVTALVTIAGAGWTKVKLREGFQI